MSRENSAVKRYRVMTKKYFNAYKSSRAVCAGSNYIIKAADETYEKFYVLYYPQSMMYKSQEHILLIDTVYADGKKIYPRDCPNIRFLTAIYHTNISTDGDICVDFLTDPLKWSPMMEISGLIASIELLLELPNVDSPYNCDASNDYKKYTALYKNALKQLPNISDEKSQTDLRETTFAPLIQFSHNYVEENKATIFKFLRYFPSLENSEHDYTNDEEYVELVTKYEKIYGKADAHSVYAMCDETAAATVDADAAKRALLERLKKKSKK